MLVIELAATLAPYSRPFADPRRRTSTSRGTEALKVGRKIVTAAVRVAQVGKTRISHSGIVEPAGPSEPTPVRGDHTSTSVSVTLAARATAATTRISQRRS